MSNLALCSRRRAVPWTCAQALGCALAWTVVAGCRAETERGVEPPHVSTTPSHETPTPVPESGPSALAEAERAVTEAMDDHFTQGLALQRKLVVADLDGAKRAAAELAADSPTSYPADWMPYVLGLRQAARTTMHAPDLERAAAGAGQIAGACGACHTALGSGPTLWASVPPADDPTGMKRHEWAAGRMWEGIVAPSDVVWREGTAGFGALPPCQPDFGGEQGNRAALAAIREHVADLTTRAAALEDNDARAALYGEYLGACASCHAAGC